MVSELSRTELRRFERFAREQLLEAGRVTLGYFRQSVAVSNKAAAGQQLDPVTEADRRAEEVIRAAIRRVFPEHGIVGEEAGEQATSGDWTWTVDPIDGTRGFVAGFVHWGMLLALSYRDTPILGLVHQPYTGELWQGSRLGAWFERGELNHSIRVRDCTVLGKAVLATTDPYLFAGAEAAAFDRLRQSVALTRYGADCYAYCMLAHGQLDLVLESGLQPWDVRALVPLIEAAGGVITDWRGASCHDGGQVLAAATPALHAEAVALLGRNSG